MPSAIFQQAFNAWLDQALSKPIPESVVAFSFNLAEPWSVEVIGSERFSEDDADWACEEAFRPKTKDFDLPEDEVGSNWETVVENAKMLVKSYLDRQSAGSDRLRQAVAVAVGFVDGELHRVWPR
jgi:shikimate kinase